MERRILLLGNPLLRKISAEVSDFSCGDFRKETADLKDALDRFRRENGFGRGIAAPQIGIAKRIIALNLGKGTFAMVNPRIISTSSQMFTMWDDCMSFPDLYVRVQRSRSISVEYQDEAGNLRKWEDIGRAESELLQHETDHLNGILSVDLALDKYSIIYKTEFNKDRYFYQQ